MLSLTTFNNSPNIKKPPQKQDEVEWGSIPWNADTDFGNSKTTRFIQDEGHSCCKRGTNPNLARGLHPWHVLQKSTLVACAVPRSLWLCRAMFLPRPFPQAPFPQQGVRPTPKFPRAMAKARPSFWWNPSRPREHQQPCHEFSDQISTCRACEVL